MDPLTHGLLGATLGQALCGRSLGRRALAWGAVLAMAPDVDVVMNATGPLAEWVWHRGPTHALWVPPVLGPAFGWLLWRSYGGPRRHWLGLALAALLSHPLLDVCTTYGTQLLAPFSRARFALDAVAIIDPAYSLPLFAALALGLRWGVSGRAATLAAWWALAASTAYLALGLVANGRAAAIGRQQLVAAGVVVDRVRAYPTLLQLPHRRIVARAGGVVRVGWVSVLAPRPIRWESFAPAVGAEVDAARATPEARLFEWFAMGEASARAVAGTSGTTIEFDDLRYGLPGHAQDGLWGVRVRLDPSGRPRGGGERFDRPLPAGSAGLLVRVWREALGVAD